ncbi:MoaF C-terminal domain-containing protein [Streptomyces sp. NPDC006872]|uniref:MoaF C-terminal domain-containing protein n=1 Tax=Streptomyces sp. NPDC006872 TaxID=3155720 RepID=UPI0033D3312D
MTLQNWKSPDDLPLLSVGISQQTQYRPPFTDDLAGRTIVLVNRQGASIRYQFETAHTLWRSESGTTGIRSYDAMRVRDGIYLVDMLADDVALKGNVPGLPAAETWALDLNSGRVTLVTSFVFERSGGARWVKSVDRHWWMEGRETAGWHRRSDGMVGSRVLWRYSDTDCYDHVYLNAHNFAWQCVSGIEAGLTELDRTRVYEVADRLYFFGWSEHVQPVESMLLVDLAKMRTYGRMFGWEARTSEVLHHQFGARGTLLNVTTYPAHGDEA